MCEMEAVEVRTFPPDVRCARNLAQYDVILHRGFSYVCARNTWRPRPRSGLARGFVVSLVVAVVVLAEEATTLQLNRGEEEEEEGGCEEPRRVKLAAAE